MATSKPRKFKLHFNRVNMQRGKDQVWTIHLSDQCIPAVGVDVNVPLRAVFNPKRTQPRAWLEGYGTINQIGVDYYQID